MKKVLPAALIIHLLFSIPEVKATCELKDNTPVVIGCTYQCNFLYRLRLNLNALSLGYPLEIINLDEEQDPTTALAKVDGVLMPGGADIHPDLYLPAVDLPQRTNFEKNRHLAVLTDEGKKRDPFEISLLKTYSSEEKYQNLPFLGICRGMQMMTVAQGIPLHLDIKTELGIDNRKYVFDEINLRQGSLLASIHDEPKFQAMKLHHQGLHLPYFQENRSKFPNVEVSALSHNGRIVESIEYKHRPAIGVQYHPEMSFTSASSPIFKWFLTKSCEFKNAVKGI